VFQYQGADYSGTGDKTFTEVTTNSGGILNLNGLRNTAASGARIEFQGDNIQIYDAGGKLRVKLGNL